MSSSPPSLLRRRRYGAAGYIAPKDTSPDAKYQTPQPIPQPVYSHHAADDLYHNLSTATALQTTSTTPLPQPVYGHRAADDLHHTSTTTRLRPSCCRRPLYHNLSTAIRLQTTSTTTCLQPSRCRRPVYTTTNDSTTTSLPQSRRPLLQPVYSHRAADDLLYNQSATEQTISSSTSLP